MPFNVLCYCHGRLFYECHWYHVTLYYLSHGWVSGNQPSSLAGFSGEKGGLTPSWVKSKTYQKAVETFCRSNTMQHNRYSQSLLGKEFPSLKSSSNPYLWHRWFDMERDGLSQVYLPKICYTSMNTSLCEGNSSSVELCRDPTATLSHGGGNDDDVIATH